jgi:hypothetical protein
VEQVPQPAVGEPDPTVLGVDPEQYRAAARVHSSSSPIRPTASPRAVEVCPSCSFEGGQRDVLGRVAQRKSWGELGNHHGFGFVGVADW